MKADVVVEIEKGNAPLESDEVNSSSSLSMRFD